MHLRYRLRHHHPGVSGSRIAADLDEQGGTLEFHYSLDVNTALVSENDVYVAVFPR